MERRLLSFIVASTAFFIVYFTLRSLFVEPPQEANQQPAIAAEQEGQKEDVEDDSEAGESTVVNESDANATDDSSEEAEAPALIRPDAAEWITLGSMDPSSNYFMLVTLNSKGAGVERVELTERDAKGALKYRRVDIRSGYLGYLAGENATTSDGVIVNVVGPGTPADLAGLQVGDVIVGIDGEAIATRDALEQRLMASQPRDSISIEVTRGATTLKLKAGLTEHPLDLIRLAKDGGPDQIVGNLSRLSCLLTLSQVNRKGIAAGDVSMPGVVNPIDLVWETTASQSDTSDSATFTVQLSDAEMKPVGGESIRLERTYSLAPSSYAIDLGVQIDNLGKKDQDLAFRLEGMNGVTLEGWWYSTKISPNFGGAAARDVVYKTAADGHELVSGFTLLKAARKDNNPSANPALPRFDVTPAMFAPDSDQRSRDMSYIGVDAQYFTVAYVPPEGQGTLNSFRRAAAGIASDPASVPRHQERAVNSTFYLNSSIATVAPGESMKQELRLFAGPKQPDLLAKYGLGDCIYYGWFSMFAKLLAGLLHLLSAVGNYALAIILLTVLVRGCMFPLSRKAAVNAQKMQELAPELKKINDQYKDDMEGKVKAQRELQQRVGFNPLAGCLPMFLQLPIFIGLYRTLSVDIELRQKAAFSFTDWASNLAGPDKLMYWGDWLWEYLSGRGTGWLGPYFNILPVIVVVLFLAQQKMFMPPATDEQTAMTQKMMNIMTLMMGLFFFRVPAGLCIYFITSSLWGICERIIVKKTLPTGKHFDAAVLEGTAAAPAQDNKSQSIAERIRSQVAKPDPPAERPNKRKRPNIKKKK